MGSEDIEDFDILIFDSVMWVQVLEIKGDNVRVCGSNRDGYVNTESRL